MPDFKTVADVASFVANCFTIVTATIAIYLFKVKGPALSAALNLLLNFSFQTTLGELKEKLERLNEYKAHDVTDNLEIVNIFHELLGQITGNARVVTAMVR
jgi:DNA-binding GntR family transcriptional regulator